MSPDLDASVILATGDGPAALTRILDALARQTIAARLEVIVLSRPEHREAIAALRPNAFGAFRAEDADLSTSARARAKGIGLARAGAVILAEDHAFPLNEDWAERLVAGLGGATGVGPVVRNANPATAASWATLFIEYGEWLHRAQAGAEATIPGHNSAYRRDVLLAYGDRLADMLEAEWVLQKDLAREGHVFRIDPGVAVAHMNYSLIRPSLRLHHVAGRCFAASRRAGWSRARALVYAVAAPAIFAKRLAAITRNAHAAGYGGELRRALPLVGLFLAASAAGEAIGYAFGAGGLRTPFAEMEYGRWRNVVPGERQLQTARSDQHA